MVGSNDAITIIAKKYVVNDDVVTLELERSGESFYSEVWFGRTGRIIPKFFAELYAMMTTLCSGGVFGTKSIEFKFPISNEIMTFSEDFAKAAGVNVSIKRSSEAGVSGNYDISDGWQVAYSGGKDSGLTYWLLDELSDNLCISTLGRLKKQKVCYNKHIPNRPTTFFTTKPYNTSHFIAVAAVHAIWNGLDKVAMGHEYNMQCPAFNSLGYFVSSNSFLSILNKYLFSVCGIRVSSVVSPLPGNRVEWLYYNRYPKEYKQYRHVIGGTGYQRLLNLYCNIPFPQSFTKTNPLPTYRRPYSYVDGCEVEHIFTTMKGHPLFGDNPLQNTHLYPWINNINITSMPVVEPDGLLSIFSEHLEKDTVDRWAEREQMMRKL